MTLKDRYTPGTVIGEFEGRPLSGYHATCATCRTVTHFTTRAVADATQDAEIEVCDECGTVAKFAALN